MLGLFCGRVGLRIPVEKLGERKRRLHCDRPSMLGLPWWLGWHEADFDFRSEIPRDAIPLLRYYFPRRAASLNRRAVFIHAFNSQ